MKDKAKLVIYCPSKLSDGGAVLLEELCSELRECHYQILIHPWIEKKINLNKKFRILRKGLIGRLITEMSLPFLVSKTDKIFCFSNIPPLFLSNKRDISIFIQNRFLIDSESDHHLDIRSRIRYQLLRTLLFLKKRSVTTVFVQGRSMCNLANKIFHHACSVKIIRFFLKFEPHSSTEEIKFDFLYVASGEKHKNHLNLFRALKLLEQRKILCRVCLTLSDVEKLKFYEYFNFFKDAKYITVESKSNLSRKSLSQLYSVSRALIFPSFVESLGLPLLEAKSLGLNIVASEKDFVRDVCEPDETFDPYSSESIADAMSRFLKSPSKKIDYDIHNLISWINDV